MLIFKIAKSNKSWKPIASILNQSQLKFLNDLNDVLKLFTEAITSLEAEKTTTVNIVVPTIVSLIEEITEAMAYFCTLNCINSLLLASSQNRCHENNS
jgi:hypothetical protein